MGNSHVCYHRVPAICNAALASVAFSFCMVAGFTCDFIHVAPRAGQYLEYTTASGIRVELLESQFGISCENPPLFERQGDPRWILSYWLWIASLVLGSATLILSWLLSAMIGPTECNWRALSILAAMTGFLQVPIFLLFDSQACDGVLCRVSTGCIMLIISTIFWITITFLTQCQDPPIWSDELDVWRVQNTKERSSSLAVQRKSRWARWTERRKWASSLGMAPTMESTEDDVMKLVEQGSYYANSTNSRLMLKVPEEEKRPGDDTPSMCDDLEEFTKFEYVQESPPSTDFEPNNFDKLSSSRPIVVSPSPKSSDAGVVTRDFNGEVPASAMIIRGHEDTQIVIVGGVNCGEQVEEQVEEKEEESSDEAKGLLDPDQVPSDLLDPDQKPSDSPEKAPSGLRGLASRMRRDRKRGAYTHLNDDEDSFADVDEPEISFFVQKQQSPPRSPMISNVPSSPSHSPLTIDTEARELLHDWETLHAAANTGILLPQTISILPADSTEDDPEPVFYSSDESVSQVSLSSFDPDDYPDDEDTESLLSGASSATMSDSSHDSCDEKANKKNSRLREKANMRRRKRRRRRAQSFSGANSVCSRTSLLALTIEEETDGDLNEDSDTCKLSKSYSLRATKSAPDQLAFSTQTRNFQSGEIVNISHESDLGVGPNTIITGFNTGIATVVESDEDESAGEEDSDVTEPIPDPLTADANHSFSGRRDKSPTTRRGRSLSLQRRKKTLVHPISDGSTMYRSASPSKFRDRIEKAGIHGPQIHVVSDVSSDDDTKDGRSCASTMSRRARTARIERLSQRRSRTLDPPQKRRPRLPPKPEIIFDPAVRAILVRRKAGMEYGPDEASL